MDDVADIVGEARGKAYFDEFRSTISAFIDEEQNLMVERQQANEASSLAAEVMIVVRGFSWFGSGPGHGHVRLAKYRCRTKKGHCFRGRENGHDEPAGRRI